MIPGELLDSTARYNFRDRFAELANRGAIGVVVGVDFADREGNPIRGRDELPQRRYELSEAKPAVAARFLGDREVEEIQDVNVDVDEQTLEASGPAVHDPARGTPRIRRHLGYRHLVNPQFVDRPALELGRVAIGEYEHMV